MMACKEKDPLTISYSIIPICYFSTVEPNQYLRMNNFPVEVIITSLFWALDVTLSKVLEVILQSRVWCRVLTLAMKNHSFLFLVECSKNVL